MIQKCPNCKLLCDATATHCDCGYEFATGRIPQSSAARKPRTTARRELVAGLLLFLAAYAIQLLAIPTRSLALNLLSLIIYGLSFFCFARSLIAWFRGRSNRQR